MIFRLTKKGKCSIFGCSNLSWCFINGLYFCSEHEKEAQGFCEDRLLGKLAYK